MKVKINQTVDLSEIPVKIREILQDCNRQVEGLSDKSVACMDVADLTVSHVEKFELLLKCVSSLRVDLGEVDQAMADLAALLEGYMGVITKSDEAKASVFPEQPQPRGSSNANEG